MIRTNKLIKLRLLSLALVTFSLLGLSVIQAPLSYAASPVANSSHGQVAGRNTISLPPPTSTTLTVTPSGTTTPLTLSSTSSTKLSLASTFSEQVTSSSPVTAVSYYLGNKLLSTITTAPYSYSFNTKAYLNGNYSFIAKTYYLNGKTSSNSYSLVIANPYSLSQLRLSIDHSAVTVVIVLLIILASILYLLRDKLKLRLRTNRHLRTKASPTGLVDTNPATESVVSSSLTSPSSLKSNRLKSLVPILLIVIGVSILGHQLLSDSHAATPYGSVEALSGALSGSALKSSDGNGVVFGTAGTTTTTGTGDSSEGDISGVPAGISTGYTMEYNFNGESAADQAATISEMKAEGVQWIRSEAYEGYPYDPIIKASVAAGINVDVIIQWSSYTDHSAATYAAWAAQAAAHYEALGVNTFELLNETNGVEDPLTPDAYTQILQAAYPAIKAADPKAFIVSAGFAPVGVGSSPSCSEGSSTNENMNAVQYLQCMYEDGAHGYFDALGDHPYDSDVPPANEETYSGWSQIDSVVSGSGLTTDIRDLMVQYGDTNKQIWVTEWGCPSDASNQGNTPPFCSDATMQTLIPQAFAFMRQSSYYGPLFFYDWIDDSVNEDGDFGLCYANPGGLTTNCANPKPDAYAAYKAAAEQ